MDAPGKVDTFDNFLDTFLSPDLRGAFNDLVDWLRYEFGVEYRTVASTGVAIDSAEEETLYTELKKVKTHSEKARSDARQILLVNAMRAKNNEAGTGGIVGFKTWWLSKDVVTQRAIDRAFGNKYSVSCYLRPDFLYNYISLAPTRAEVDSAYRELFPSLLGVNISSHLPHGVVDFVQKKVAEHETKNPARIKAVLRSLADGLKTDSRFQSREYLRHYLDSELKKIEDAQPGEG